MNGSENWRCHTLLIYQGKPRQTHLNVISNIHCCLNFNSNFNCNLYFNFYFIIYINCLSNFNFYFYFNFIFIIHINCLFNFNFNENWRCHTLGKPCQNTSFSISILSLLYFGGGFEERKKFYWPSYYYNSQIFHLKLIYHISYWRPTYVCQPLL